MAINPAVVDLLKRAGMSIAGRVVANAAKPCGCPKCPKKSPGIGCQACGVPMCIEHAFVTMSASPQTVCGKCAGSLWKE